MSILNIQIVSRMGEDSKLDQVSRLAKQLANKSQVLDWWTAYEYEPLIGDIIITLADSAYYQEEALSLVKQHFPNFNY